MFRRWRVRHSYPRPVVELVVRLMPIHGAAVLSRQLDIPTSVIYRWRTRNRDCAALPGNPAVDAETLAALVARCEELGFRLAGNTRATTDRACPSTVQRGSATHASLGNSLHDTARAATTPLRNSGDCAGGQLDVPAPESSCLPARSRATGQRYVFDACKERPVRGVRSRMEAVRQAIDTRYFLDVDCRTLAETARMSLHHFIRVFRDMFGMSPHQYLTRTRVEAAKRLLLASSEPIEVIALGVGFRSGPSLNRAFKRVEGASVSKYCQTAKKNSIGGKQRALMPAVAGWSRANDRRTHLSVTA
jgi:AraC-like DNA-binding protein